MNLKSIREDKLKYTKEDFSALIGITVSELEKLEKTNAPSLPLLETISQKTGIDFNTLLAWKKPKPKALNVKDNWSRAKETGESLSSFIKDTIADVALSPTQRAAFIDDLEKGIAANAAKPSLAIVGRSDTGKSTMINALLGVEKMPTAWTPTTSIAVYIKHISDRPSFIEEDAWVFADSMDEETHWNDKRLYDEAYCNKWKVAAGKTDILRTYGTWQGSSYQEAGSAVLFIDAPILCNCDIIDLPGFGTQNERDDKITFNITERADAIIYLSQANGFMRIEDINYLKCNINTLPAWERKNENDIKPLGNLFIVASQAHNVTDGNRKELKEILDHGCHALQNSLQDDFWCERMKVSGYDADSYDEDSLRKRFFTYTTDIPELCENFHASLREITEQLSLLVERKIRFFAMQYVKDRNPALYAEISKYEEILSMREKYIFLLSEIDANEGKRAEENYQRKVEINDLIETLRKNSITEFSDFCASNFMPNAIVDLLKNREVKNTTEDVGQFTSWFQGHIQSHCDEILQKKSKELTDKTEDYIQKFNDSISAAFQANHVNASFDAGWAFMSALAKFGVFGGLGGLIAGTGVIAFGSLSLLLGGAGTAAVVACGLGPIGVAVGGVMLLAMGLMSLVSGGWKKSVAKEISKDLEKRNVAEQYRTVMKNYWKQTLDAFNHAADTLDEEWQNYVGQLRDAVSEDDGEANSNALQELRVIKVLFDNILTAEEVGQEKEGALKL